MIVAASGYDIQGYDGEVVAISIDEVTDVGGVVEDAVEGRGMLAGRSLP